MAAQHTICLRALAVGTVFVLMTALLMAEVEAAPPSLPEGLDAPDTSETDTPREPSSQPPLPAGLGAPDTDAPSLPPGLSTPAERNPAGDPQADQMRWRDLISGFIEGRLGYRTENDPFQKDASIAEGRAQLAVQASPGPLTLRLVTDVVYDDVEESRAVDLETGRGWIDLREANLVARPFDFADVKIGRQILTWGTGDLVFINDLFPKDFRAFFIGRDEEYLKAPSDAVRISTFFDLANLDVVYTPRFDADRSIDGTRLSFFSPTVGRLAGRDAILPARAPDGWFSDGEVAARLYRNIGSFETALYAYDGFWKAPGGISASGQALHPDLRVIGASLRGPLLGGIVSTEIGHYESRDDRDGSNPLIQNGETRYLVGFEREALPELTVGVQYYAQRLTDHDALRGALLPGQRTPDRTRHTLTLRATKTALNQTLTLSAFTFWSPNDDDGHVRLRASYKITDEWLTEAGANLFFGPDDQTFFGQLKKNNNLFVGVRRSF